MTPKRDIGDHSLSRIEEICAGPVLIDTCLLFAGITRRLEKGFSFDDIRIAFLDKAVNRLKNVLIHEAVIKELEGTEIHSYIMSRVDLNIHIVTEEDRYGTDPLYTQIFDEIAKHFAFRYVRNNLDLMLCPRKNRGEIASLAYASYHNIPFFATYDQDCYIIKDDILSLNLLKIFGSEVLLVLGYDKQNCHSDNKKRIKALYKYLCAARIKQNKLPATFNEYYNKFSEI